MMFYRLPLLTFFVFSIFLASFPAVSAIGISPGMLKIDFEPWLNKTHTYYVRGGGLPIEVYTNPTKCILSEYIKPSISYVELSPGEIRYFSVEINLPGKIEEPGLHKCEIIASEVKQEDLPGVSALSGVGASIYIYVPYPYKYLQAVLHAANVNMSKPVPFNIELKSRGIENVTASATITIYDINGKSVATLYTSPVFVESQKTGELSAVWDTTGMPPGRYLAKAVVEYGGEEPALPETEFKIGDILLRILNITYSEGAKPGDIVRFNVDIDSYWNSKIEGAYIDLSVKKEGNQLSTTRSESFDIDAWSERIVTVYWDTSGLDEGEYELEFLVKYEGRTTAKSINIELRYPFNEYIIFILIAVAVAIAVTVIYLKKKRKKRFLKGEMHAPESAVK
jgi:hypothetical protein